MSESLGLSLGVANLVAARAGSTPVSRKSVLTVYAQQPSEVGLPEENPNPSGPGLVMRGFIERVGDRTPLVAADGTKYLGEALTVEALEVMARTVGYGTPVTIAVPAYWSEGQYAAMRAEFFAQPTLAPDGVPPVLISDATAALAALRAQPQVPTAGVVVLCDFGASGTNITAADAGASFQQIGPSVRYTEFSGDTIDQLILNHLRAAAPNADTTGGLANTTRMGSLTRLLGECQRAKEQLSAADVATVPADSGEDVRLSRTEFDEIISGPLDRFISAVEEILQRNGIPQSNLAAVAAVGGGASIPLLATRLSGRLSVPILTTAQPAYSAAVGAAVLGQQQSSAGLATAASPIVENPTELVATPTLDVTEAPLAWSEDADTDEPIPYTGPEHSGQYVRDAMEFDDAEDNRYGAAPLPWYKRTVLILSVAGAAAALLLLGVVLALALGRNETNPVPPSQKAPATTPQTVTVTEPNNSPTETVTSAPPPPSTTTTEAPVTTTTPPITTTPPPTTTTTTLPPTTAPSPPTRERPRLWEPPWRR
jgi:hypothetical protein